MITQITKDGPKNCSILVKGIVQEIREPVEILDLKNLTAPTQGWKGLRLDSVVWMIQEKMGLYLWWHKEQTESSLILPMESRNFLRTDEGITSPRVEKGWEGKIWMSSFREHELPGDKAYLLILDFDKQ